MAKLMKIAKHEFITTVTRRSFLLALILVPLLPALLMGGVSLLNRNGNGPDLEGLITGANEQGLPMGVVDQSGLIKEFPEWLTGGALVQIADESNARAQVEAGKLQGYYLILPDYLNTGDLRMVKPSVSLFGGMGQANQLDALIQYNLLGADQALFQSYKVPVSYEYQPINPETADRRDAENIASFFIPYGVTIFFYMMIVTSSTMMLQAITKEKENRVMEVLLSSTSPADIFAGKVIGLGGAALLQMAVWSVAAVLILRLGGGTLNIPAGMQIPWAAVAWGLPFFLLGFALYGSLMAGLGAIAPNLREAGQSTFFITVPLMVTMLAVSQLVEAPRGPVAMALSLIPLTSPVAMPVRISISAVPFWQILLSMVLLAGTAWFVLKGVTRLFHAQYLLTGQKVGIKTFFKALFSPAG